MGGRAQRQERPLSLLLCQNGESKLELTLYRCAKFPVHIYWEPKL